MVQRTENEEAEFKVPETLSLCVNNCGLSGNPTTNNLCESCFKATAGILKLRKFSSRGKPRLSTSRSPERSGSDSSAGAHGCVEEEEKEGEGKDATSRKQVNRCSGCRRKVGLTGFRCRCGDLFCSEHRYSDRHVCSYDYKAAGREAIAQENPVVKAAKIVRI